VVVDGDPRVCLLWQRLLDDKHFGGQYPWEQSLMQMARNHRAGNTDAGDMARFALRGFAHVARKIVFAPDRDRMRVYPRTFWNGEAEVEVDEELLWATWEIATALLKGVLPPDGIDRSYAMSLEFLRYPDCSSDLDDVLDFINDSSGGWTRFGRRLDSYKNLATSTFDLPAIRLRDWFAFGSMVPGVRHALHWFNRLLDQYGNNTVPAGHRIIGGAHIDGSKVLTLLLSERSVIKTEIRDGKNWIPLPLSKQSFALLPAHDITKFTNLEPTCHRVLMDTERQPAPKEMNLTVAVCIVDHEQLTRIASDQSMAFLSETPLRK
jgi:hypothetical protein